MAAEAAHRVLAALGTRALSDRLTELEALGEAGADALFSALAGPPVSSPGHPRDAFDDQHGVVGRLAARWPDALVRAIHAHPALLGREAVVGALREVPGEQAGQWLLDALGSRHGYMRWVALLALLGRGEPKLGPRLAKLLEDRDHIVAFTAVQALQRLGTAGDLDAIARYAETASIGGQEWSWDATEAICAREGLPLPAGHPGPRLVEVRLPEGAEATVGRAERVEPGRDLGGATSPVRGVVSLLEPGRVVVRRVESWGEIR